MNTEIKCPNCGGQFSMDVPDSNVEKMMGKPTLGMVITLCQECMIPLVQFNDSDAWEVFEPEMLQKLPAEARAQVAGIVAMKLMQAKQSVDEPVTPFTRAHFFMAGNELTSEGCVVLLRTSEWKSFAELTKVFDRPFMCAALEIVATHDYKQNTDQN